MSGLGCLLLGLAFLSVDPSLDTEIWDVRAGTYTEAEPFQGERSLSPLPLQDPKLGNYLLLQESEPGQPVFYTVSFFQAKEWVTPSLWLFIRRFESLGIIIPHLNGPAIIYPFHSFF